MDSHRRTPRPVDRLPPRVPRAEDLGQAPLVETQYPSFQPTSTSKFDAVVVLAGGVFQKGSLRPADEVSDASRQRTGCGADLWQQNLAPKLLLTGGDATVFRTGLLESHEMKRWALRLGVPESAILIEEQSRTTYENAVQTKAILGSGRIILVTAAYHLPRAVRLFEKQGFVVTPFPCGYESQHTPQQAWEQATLFDFLPTASTKWQGSSFIGLPGNCRIPPRL